MYILSPYPREPWIEQPLCKKASTFLVQWVLGDIFNWPYPMFFFSWFPPFHWRMDLHLTWIPFTQRWFIPSLTENFSGEEENVNSLRTHRQTHRNKIWSENFATFWAKNLTIKKIRIQVFTWDIDLDIKFWWSFYWFFCVSLKESLIFYSS